MRWPDVLCAAIFVACAPHAAPLEAPVYLDIPPLPPRVVDITIHGDTRHDRLERIIWEASCDHFRILTRGRAQCAIVWDYDENRLLDLADRPHIQRLDRYEDNVGGERVRITIFHQFPIGDELRIVPSACPELLACTKHELGHMFGFEDLHVEGAVMSMHNPSTRFTRDDLEECRRIGLCERGP